MLTQCNETRGQKLGLKYLIIAGYPVIKGNLVVRKVEITAMKDELRGKRWNVSFNEKRENLILNFEC